MGSGGTALDAFGSSGGKQGGGEGFSGFLLELEEAEVDDGAKRVCEQAQR